MLWCCFEQKTWHFLLNRAVGRVLTLYEKMSSLFCFHTQTLEDLNNNVLPEIIAEKSKYYVRLKLTWKDWRPNQRRRFTTNEQLKGIHSENPEKNCKDKDLTSLLRAIKHFFNYNNKTSANAEFLYQLLQQNIDWCRNTYTPKMFENPNERTQTPTCGTLQ